MTISDFNGDDTLDLAVTTYDSNTVSLLLGNGDGTFQSHVDYATATRPNISSAGDFNGDGKMDLAVVCVFGDAVTILLQTPPVNENCLPPPAGLVSWWSGDKTAEDVQGPNPGVLKNGASFRPGKVGPGFVFDGIDDWVRIPDSPFLSQTRITVDAWVYVTGGQGTDRHMIEQG